MPEFEWKMAEPETRGLSSERLDALVDGLARHNTNAFLVIRDDHIVKEWYSPDWQVDKPHYTASLAKAIVGGVSLMLAMDDGLMEPDDPASKYIPEWRDDPLKSKITVRHLATHSSGVEDAELSRKEREEALAKGVSLSDHHMKLPGWKGAFWRQEPDPFTLARDEAPVVFEPGKDFAYSNPGMAMLAYAVTAAIQDGPHKDIRTLLSERVMKPIGVPDGEWSVGYGKTFEVNGLPLVANWGGGSYTARAVARVGRLMLREGDWEGTQLVRRESVRAVVSRAGTPAAKNLDGDYGIASGLGWWTTQGRVYSVLLPNTYAGAGAGNQHLWVLPYLDMIVVRMGGNLGNLFWTDFCDLVVRPLVGAVLPCHPPSPVIRGVEWAAKESIRRDAWDSDTWPLTWGDDDALYAAWADGKGFAEPPVEEKSSLGFARISGPPEDYEARNVRSESGEDMGGGPVGKKASGLLMVDGILYMWVRNANRKGEQCQLAWSEDHAATWTWSGWSFEQLGYCTFLNFGRDYDGARDEFVYVYSPDGPSAYIPVDRFVLLRVPKDRIRDREAYEYFAGLDGNGDPQWSRDFEKRQGVFDRKRRCLRSSVSYNAGLGRYLWWQCLPNAKDEKSELRFTAGFGLFDAPEPWGPWTTAFYSEYWDTGPGETACVPTKWMSGDGRRFWLVFSGDDYFSLREGRLVLRED